VTANASGFAKKFDQGFAAEIPIQSGNYFLVLGEVSVIENYCPRALFRVWWKEYGTRNDSSTGSRPGRQARGMAKREGVLVLARESVVAAAVLSKFIFH
jgi:hypothetical protein